MNPLGVETTLSGLAISVGCGSYGASMVLSMVFSCCGLFPLGFCGWLEWKTCLANMRHDCGVGVGCCCPIEASIGSLCRILAKHGFGGNLVAAGSPEHGNHA